MKTFFLATAIVLASAAAWAQTPPAMPASPAVEAAPAAKPKEPRLDPVQRSTQMASRLTKKLGLDADQSSKVQATLLEQFTKLEQLRQQRQGKGQAKAIKDETEAKLQQILGPEKFAKMQALRQEQRQKRGVE